MTTTIRHVTLKSLGKNKDINPMKGTVTNPFTQEEYNNLNQTGEWPGGYVEAMGYVAPPMMDGMGDGSGSGSAITKEFKYNFVSPYIEGTHAILKGVLIIENLVAWAQCELSSCRDGNTYSASLVLYVDNVENNSKLFVAGGKMENGGYFIGRASINLPKNRVIHLFISVNEFDKKGKAITTLSEKIYESYSHENVI